MLRSISSVLLPRALEIKLRDVGFQFCEDFYTATGGCHPSVSELLKQFGLDETYLKRILSHPSSCTALDIWQVESSLCHIVTFCKELDDMLDGGIPLRQITEICGAPGSGKTQLCLQLCIDVQIPISLGGLGSQAVFITTDSGFSAERLKDMAEGCFIHCKYISSMHKDDPNLQKDVRNLSTDSFMNGVHVIDVQGYEKLLAVVHQLSGVLNTLKKVQLIIIDSLAFSFRDGEINTLERTALLYRLLGDLQSYASNHSLAVVVTNQVTTRMVPGKESQLTPALGDSFGHRVNLRLMLDAVRGNCFAAALLKSPTRPRSVANFIISHNGVRDCE